jgi:cysteine desulfurase
MTAPARTVDALGTYCPVPLHLLARAIVTVEVGETVELLADDPLIRIDLPAWCHDTGHELLEVGERSGEHRAVVRRAV